MKMTWLSYTGQPNVWVVKFDDGVEVRTEGPSFMEPEEPVRWTRVSVPGGHWLAPRSPGGLMIVDAADYPQHVAEAHQAVIDASNRRRPEIM